MQELTIKDILKILKKRWWMIVAFCLIVTVGAGLYYQRKPDVYVAQTTLYVLLDYEDEMTGQTRYETAISQQFAGDFKELIRNPAIMSKAMDRMKIGKAEFSTISIGINAVAGTRILRLSATGYDPNLCMQAANTVSQVFIEYIQDVMKADVVTFAVEATVPAAASGPDRLKDTLLAGALSIILAAGIVVILEMLNTSLRSVESVEGTLDLPVLASIQNYKKDIERFLQKRSPGEMLLKGVPTITKENIKTLVTNIQFTSIAHPAQTLLVTSSVTGEGKSSLLLLLAEAFADLGKCVLVVDMDLRNPSIGQYLGVRGRNDLFDYMVGHARLEEVSYKTSNPGIHFIDSRHHLASVSQIVNFEVFEKFLDAVKQVYDVILFDTPPLGLFIDAAALANKMDATLLVVGSGMSDRAVVKDVVEQLHKANANILGVALNFVNQLKIRQHHYEKKYGGKAEKKVSAPFKKTAQET